MSYITKENTQDIYPLSPLQKGMLFHAIYNDKSPMYFEQLAFTIKGSLNRDAFNNSWAHVIASTPVFRTVFKWTKVKEPVQLVLKEFPVEMKFHDISDNDESDQKKIINDFLKRDRAIPFNLEEGPLMRLNMFILAPDKHHFIWSHHHIMVDGWCMSHVLRDVFEAYMKDAAGNPMPESGRLPYKDYIAWFLKQDKEAADEFWKSKLLDFETATVLPYDDNKKLTEITTSKTETIVFSETATSKINEFVKKERITQSTFLQTLWSLLLSYYSNSDDIVFGVTSSGRPAELKGSDDMIGLFINTLPMRVKLSKDMSVSELFKNVQELSLEIRDYEYSFLPDIKACSSVPRTQNLFDSITVFENYPLDSIMINEGENFGISDVHIQEMTNFPLTVLGMPGKNFTIKIMYSDELFSDERIKGLVNHLNNIVEQILESPDMALSEINILSESEKSQIMNDFNATKKDYPLDKCMYQIIEDQVARTPDNIAVSFEDASLTYDELNKKANQLAHFLRKEGVGRDVMVALTLDRSLEMEIALLGVMKSGGAYVPIGTEYPESRIDYILEDTETPIVLVHERFAQKYDGKHVKVVCLDRDWDMISNEEETNPKPVNGPDDLIYVLYTSGSTGIPKGVANIHRSLTNRIVWMQDAYQLKEDDCILQKTPYTFDVSGWEFHWAVMYGARIHYLKPGGEKDPLHILETIEKEGITTLHFVPSMLGAFLNILDNSNKKATSSLRRVICSGEALLAEHRNTFFEYINCELHNLYGPTEAAIDVTYYECRPEQTENNIPIGKPIANTEMYVLDRNLNLLPPGVTGELYIGGVNLAREYVKKPEKTAEAFIETTRYPGGRLYRTGDLGAWLPDGNIIYLGRIDHQVKIRGNRIELGEVESALRNLDGVKEAVTMVKTLDTGNKMLAAYYVADNEIPAGDIRANLVKAIPQYMIPNQFLRLDSFPLNPNGKLDKSALPEIKGLSESSSEYAAPANELQALLASIWQAVLGVEKVGVNDNFFDLGGDSIISLQVVGRLKKEGFHIHPRDIFEYQTIAELSAIVKELEVLAIEQGPVVGEVKLTPVMKWFFDLELENKNHFNQTLIFRTKVKLDEDALKQSFQSILDHHDILRMQFKGGKAECLEPDIDVTYIKKTVSSKKELKNEINSMETMINLEEGPLMAAGLIAYDGYNYLAMSIHHNAVDGVSWRILLEDMFINYGRIQTGEKIKMPDKTTSFKDWSEKLYEYAASEKLKTESVFWNDMFSNSNLSIPVDHNKGPNNYGSTNTIQVDLNEVITDNLLREANKTLNTEVNDLLLTALMRALAEWTDNDNVLFNLEGHGREDVIDSVDTSRTIGWFTTIYPVLLHNTSTNDIIAQIKYVKEKLRSIPDKGFNYGIMKYLCSDINIENSEADIVFNYLGQINKGELGESFELVDDLNIDGTAKENIRPHLIDINCKVQDDKLRVDITYSKNKFDDSTMQEIADNYKKQIKNVVTCCVETDLAGYTPSDFQLADISQDQLDDLIDDLDDI